jgi:glycosyltransferase involved in cell wall biosynthesis
MFQHAPMSDSKRIKEVTVGCQIPDTKPVISVIIPNYNTAQFIGETLDSVLAQSFTEYEIIVVNDGAPDTDELLKVLEKYQDKITLIDKSVNEGTSASRNLAVEYARGDMFAFLDADDIWYPSFLAELYRSLEANDFDMVYAAAETFGHRRLAAENFLGKNPAGGEITRRMLVEGKCLILPSGALIRKKAFLASGGFDPSIKRTEDFDLWMRMLFDGARIGYLRKILFRFRIRPGSGSGDSIQRIERSRYIWSSLQKRLPFTDDENRIIDLHILGEEAAILRARGKVCVVQKDWKEAKENFRRASTLAGTLDLPLKHRLKLAAVLFLLNTYPSLLWRLFQKDRGEEIDFMPLKASDR